MESEQIEEGDFVKWKNGSGYVVKVFSNFLHIDDGSCGTRFVDRDQCEMVAKQYRLEV